MLSACVCVMIEHSARLWGGGLVFSCAVEFSGSSRDEMKWPAVYVRLCAACASFKRVFCSLCLTVYGACIHARRVECDISLNFTFGCGENANGF